MCLRDLFFQSCDITAACHLLEQLYHITIFAELLFIFPVGQGLLCLQQINPYFGTLPDIMRKTRAAFCLDIHRGMWNADDIRNYVFDSVLLSKNVEILLDKLS